MTLAIIISSVALISSFATLVYAVRIRKFATEVNDFAGRVQDFAHDFIGKTDADLQIFKRDIKQHVTAVLSELGLEKKPEQK